MEGNSPGKRGRSGLSSRLNFFENLSTSGSSSSNATEVFDQSSVEELERQMRARREQQSKEVEPQPQVVTLRRVLSPVRSPNYVSEVFVSSWTERVQSSEPDIQPPWRRARLSEPEHPSSPFLGPPSPNDALNKYQEWRARRFTTADPSSFSAEAPWRRRTPSERSDHSGSSSSHSFKSSSKASQQPQWYSEFRTASMTQAAASLESYRTGFNTHYDYHIAIIKGIYYF